ncbi:alpha-N-acetylgalactosaminidase-like isoform X2 [Physella acuta]|uniref:alpha-N-acetylgalactosaminidase-like isoform X2 n=1 Tax=Physella acuta TaxID=109671 RepID=UPI0027DDD38A|nr:alpha-N-acetylgalactosaminidase-like isoform X2 [Physella acuta]
MLLQVVCVFLLACHLSQALDNGLALTPPMGWLSWERFRCNVDCDNDPDNCISERLYMKMADLMVSEGFKDVGYEFVNIDDCWPEMERDSNGRLVADRKRFPSGIKALAKYIHSKGLKLGIYEDFGSKTCAGYPGSEYYMETDAKTFAEWDIDMLKFDGCYSDPNDMPYGYPIMERFLNMTGHPILFLCQWPGYLVGVGLKPDFAAIRASCNQWRNYVDVQDGWDSVLKIVDWYGQDEGNFSAFAGPGGWNDPDMLVVGDFGLSYYQQKAQFALWALWASPLMMSVDLRSVDPQAKAILQNKNVIAINQDPLGNQAVRLFEVPGSISVWVKKLSTGSLAIGVLNKNNEGTPVPFKTSFADLGFSNKNGYSLTEVFENKPIGKYQLTQQFVIYVEPTSCFLMTATPL